MKHFLFSLPLLCVLVLAPATVAAEQDTDPGKTATPIIGTVVRVDEQKLVLTVKPKGKKAQEQTVNTDGSTVVKLDGEPSTLDALKPGMRVTVPHYEDKAASVNAISPPTRGTLLRIGSENVVMLVKEDGGESTTEVSVPTTKKTLVRLNGKKVSLSELKPGMVISVPKFKDAAKRLDARTPKSKSGSAEGSGSDPQEGEDGNTATE